MSKDSKKSDVPFMDDNKIGPDDFNTMALASDMEIVEDTRRELDASERLARTQEQLKAFLNIAQVVGLDPGSTSVFELICDQTTQLMRAQRTCIFGIEKEKDKTFLLSKTTQGGFQMRLELGQSIAGTVAKRRQNLNIKDVYKSQLFDPRFDRKTGFRTESCLCAPIFDIENELIGVVEVINKINGYFTIDDEDFLTSICAQIAISLTQQRSYVKALDQKFAARAVELQLLKKNEELDMLYGLERAAASASSLDELVQRMLSKSLQSFEAHFVGILLVEGTSHRLYAVNTSGSAQVFEEKLLKRLPAFITVAMQHNDCVSLNYTENRELGKQSLSSFGVSLGHLLIVSLWSSETCFGALILGRRGVDLPKNSDSSDPHIFQPVAAKLASIFAAHLAPSISAHLARQAQEKERRLTVIGQMMSSLLHDMKTPLAIISGYAEMMVTQEQDQKRQVYADTIDKQIEALKAMSAEILLFARGETLLILAKIQLASIVKEALELLLPEAKRHRIELASDLRFLGEIECDETKIQRVIINLAKNAMEAIGQDGKITISTYADETHAYLAVQDDGPGIPSKEGDTIFDAFVSFGKKNGTGLGLSIVKKIVQEHKASITYQAVKPRGTVFVIAFPTVGPSLEV